MGKQLALEVSSAILSPDGVFRYYLSREFTDAHAGNRRVLWVCCNPSTADAAKDDPTIRKCRGFSKHWGFGGFWVVNLWAYHTSKTKVLKSAGFPVGPENDNHIVAASSLADAVVMAWGGIVHHRSPRPPQVFEIVRASVQTDVPIWCLGRCKDRQPQHPLMLPYATPREIIDKL